MHRMPRRYMITTFIFVFSIIFTVNCTAKPIDSLLADISIGNIISANVISRSSLRLTPIAVSPEQFYSFASKNCIMELTDSLRNDLEIILRSARRADSPPIDAYWRVGFYDKSGSEVYSLYMGRSFNSGNDVTAILDGDRMLISEQVVDWFQNKTSDIPCSKITRVRTH